MKTLDGDRVCDKILHTWCAYLNELEKLSSPQSPARIYASLTKEVSLEKVVWKQMNLVFFPVIISRWVLICVNNLKSKIEVIHLMEPGSLKYDDLVERVKKYMVKEFGRLPWLERISKFQVEEFVPKLYASFINDNGVVFMRIMEVYKGNRKGLTKPLTDIVNENQKNVIGPSGYLKLKVKYCHAILTSKGNSLKAKVIEGVKSRREQDLLHHFSTVQLKDFVYDLRRDAWGVVDIEWWKLTRRDMRTLAPGVNLSGIEYVTKTEKRREYLPTTIRHIHDVTSGLVRGAAHYFPKNGSKCKKVIRASQTVPKYFKEYEMFQDIANFKMTIMEVPKHIKSVDSGLHVLKFIEAFHNIKMWENKEYFQASNLSSLMRRQK